MYQVGPPGERSTIPKFAKYVFMLVIMSIFALIVLIGLKPPESSTQAGSFQYAIVTQEVASGEGYIIGVNNAILYVPQGAITMAGSITIFPREPNLFSTPGDREWERSLVVNVEFRDGEGTLVPKVTFATPAEICFKITRERWNDYSLHPDEYQVHTYSEEANPPAWQPLNMVAYPDRLHLCGQTDHLSLFALATRPQTVIPLTGPTPTPEPNQTQPASGRLQDVYEP